MIGKENTPITCPQADTCGGVCLDCRFAREQATGSIKRLRDMALKTQADVYHIRGGELFDEFPNNVKTVLTGVPESFFTKSNAERDIARFATAGAVIALNKSAIPFINSFGADAKLVPVSADTDSFNLDVKKETVLGPTEGYITIGYIGSLQHYQSTNMLLDAVSVLNNEGHKVKLLACLSRENHAEEFGQRARLLGLGKHTSIVVNTPNNLMPPMLAGCDLLHLVRDFAPEYPMTPIKLLDYMAMNKPFLYSAGDAGITELWEDKSCEVGETNNNFLDAYRRAIEKLPDSTGMRTRLFEEGRDMVSAAKSAKKVYEDVA
jgi:glycosyltransferase involved in cell wall biosynthesis